MTTENEARTPSELIPPTWLLPALETPQHDPCKCHLLDEGQEVCAYCRFQSFLDVEEDDE